MTGVLIVGASGYIGKAVASACRRDGYTVYAQSRNASKTQEFSKEEFIPLICDPTDANALATVIPHCQFVIDCTSVIMDGEKIPNACLEAIRLCEVHKDKHYIFTSGLLVYGDVPGQLVNEEMPRKHPMLGGRIEIEDVLLNPSMDVKCTVLRPGFVYGKSGGGVATSMLFMQQQQSEGIIPIGGNPQRRWSWVHIDDLAEAYVSVIHRTKMTAGRAYDLAENFGPTYEEVKVAAAKAMGGGDLKIEYSEAEHVLDVISNVTVVITGKRARDELGWVPWSCFGYGTVLQCLQSFSGGMRLRKERIEVPLVQYVFSFQGVF
eukprot:scaffold64050_cov37-Cyclotella_meneghiniana.AAC.1